MSRSVRPSVRCSVRCSAILLVFFLVPALLQAVSPGLDGYVRREMQRAHVPGLAAGIVADGELVWAKGYGQANVEEGRGVTPDTLFNLASVSKTVTATAVMQLVESGQLDLDADVNRYLPVALRHPRHPDVRITARQLLTHSASIQDDWDLLDAGYVDGRDSPVSLGSFLFDTLHPRGRHYNGGRNFYAFAPGKRFEYSNVGYALLGHLVEVVSDQPFDVYCRRHIFRPLGMDDTGWRLADMDRRQVAMPYEYRGGRFRPYGHYGYPEYPSGLLRSSVRELSRFVTAHLRGGALDGERILLPRTARAMRTVQNPRLADDMGLGFFVDRTGGVRVHGHDGGDYGVSTQMWMSRAHGLGVILLTNGDALTNAESKALERVLERLIQEARAF